ncbi:MAG: ribonuclease Z [Bacteroidota bacterium]
MSVFEVRILGTSAAIPTNSRLPSAQVVTINDRHHLVDCGEGTQIQMIRQRVKFSRLDAIFISHLHGDHVLGVPGLLSSMSIYERNFPLKLFAPSGLKDILDLVFSQTHSYLTYPLEFIPTEDFDVGDVIHETDKYSVSLLPLEHRIFSRGFLFKEVNKKPKFDFYKAKSLEIPNNYFPLLKQGNVVTLEDGRQVSPEEVLAPADHPLSYAYCSDTRYNPAIVDHIKDSLLLYHESTFLHALKARADETYHSTAKEAAKIAKDARVKKLLLGHFSARYRDLAPLVAEAQRIFPEVEAAREGQVFNLKDLAKAYV